MPAGRLAIQGGGGPVRGSGLQRSDCLYLANGRNHIRMRARSDDLCTTRTQRRLLCVRLEGATV